MKEAQRVFCKVDKLIDVWCERRCLQPLTYLLRGYPFVDKVKEEWEILQESLQEIKGFCSHELTPDERKLITELIDLIDKKSREFF